MEFHTMVMSMMRRKKGMRNIKEKEYFQPLTLINLIFEDHSILMEISLVQ